MNKTVKNKSAPLAPLPAAEKKLVGVIGAGSFGTAICHLLSYNTDVLVFTRRPEIVRAINDDHFHYRVKWSERVRATSDLEEVAQNCTLIFVIIPAVHFRKMMQNLGIYLRPYHILVHGTKGLDLVGIEENEMQHRKISRKNICTMSEVIRQESSVVRVGCLSGPNLASEILVGQPTASVIGSRFDEVISACQSVLQSTKFHVFGSHDILGAELAGVLKNVIAIGSGILAGKGMGKNIQAMLITRGLTEIIHLGKAMGASSKSFIGTAGIGDLVATATSPNSRNFTLGFRLAQGEKMTDIIASMSEQAEGIRTLKMMRQLARNYKLHSPIVQMLYSVVFEDFEVEKALDYLMTYPYAVDVDFL